MKERSAGAYPSSPRAKGRGTTWTDFQPIAGPHVDEQPHTLTVTSTGNSESPVNLTCISLLPLDCGRKSEYPEKAHLSTGENAQAPHRKAPARTLTRNLLATVIIFQSKIVCRTGYETFALRKPKMVPAILTVCLNDAKVA